MSENQRILPKQVKGSLQKSIYKSLFDSIINNEIAIGSLLSERDLSVQFGTSRTPVREAFKQLEYDGLVEIIPHKGVFVADIRFEDVFEIYEARAGLDEISVRLFIQRKNEERVAALIDCMNDYKKAAAKYDIPTATKHNVKFHLLIAEGTLNSRIINYETQLIRQCQRAMLLNTIDIAQQDLSVKEHELILKHIIDGNVPAAEQAAKQHILDGFSYLAGIYKMYFDRNETGA